MNSDELTRYVAVLNDWIAKSEELADDLGDVAADLRRSGRQQLADDLLACSRRFRITALELRGQLAAAKPFEGFGD